MSEVSSNGTKNDADIFEVDGRNKKWVRDWRQNKDCLLCGGYGRKDIRDGWTKLHMIFVCVTKDFYNRHQLHFTSTSFSKYKMLTSIHFRRRFIFGYLFIWVRRLLNFSCSNYSWHFQGAKFTRSSDICSPGPKRQELKFGQQAFMRSMTFKQSEVLSPGISSTRPWFCLSWT